MPDALLVTRDSHQLAYVLGSTTRIRTNCGVGVLVYVTDDRYLGVRLDGETRIDEYNSDACQVVR